MVNVLFINRSYSTLLFFHNLTPPKFHRVRLGTNKLPSICKCSHEFVGVQGVWNGSYSFTVFRIVEIIKKMPKHKTLLMQKLEGELQA